MSKLSELATILAADLAGGDLFMVVDTSATASKAITYTELSSLFGSDPAWGAITGTLADQTDLQSALDLKANASSLSSYVPFSGAASALNLGANNFTVDTNVFFVDAANDRVSVGTTTLTGKFNIKAASATTIGQIIELAAAQTANAFEVNSNGGSGGGIFVITAAGRVGVNEASPTRTFTINKDALGYTPKIPGDAVLQVASSGSTGINISSVTWGNGDLTFSDIQSTRGLIRYYHGDDSMSLFTAATERVRITNTGLVGIGESTPTALLHLAASTTARASLRIVAGTAPTSPNDGDIWFDGTDIKMRIAGATKTFTLT